MNTWTAHELERIGGAGELRLASRRGDGSLRPYVTMWVVRAGDGLYIRSAYGPGNPWYRRAIASGTGRIRAGGIEKTCPSPQPNKLCKAISTPPTTPSTTATGQPSSAPSPAAPPTR